MFKPEGSLAESVDQMLVVACDQDGDADGVEILKHPHDFLGKLGIEIAGGLIREDQLGFVDNCPGNSDALLLSARERHRQAFFFLEKTDFVERGSHPSANIMGVMARDVERERDIFKDTAVIQKPVVLENQAQLSAKMRNLPIVEL
ncbi:MAG: hypothetical protein RLZZ627_293, partial [Pseudomonadota bacterium]